MPKISVNQANFTAGEITPRMKGRTDVARYQAGAEIMENCRPAVHGGADGRDGLAFCAVAKLAGTRKVRLLRYVFSVDQAYVIELGHLYARVFDPAGAVVLNAGLTALELVHPYTEKQIFQLTTLQGGDTLFLFHPDVRPHKLRRVTANNWEIVPVTFVVEPFDELGHKPNASLTISATGLGSRLFTTNPTTVPSAPTSPVATPLNAAANVAFTTPADNGGTPITLYTVTSSPGGLVGTGGESPVRVGGLTNGTAYTFTVTATNAVGTSVASAASAAVTPLATLASAQISVTLSVTDKYIDAANGTISDITGPIATGSAGLGGYTYAWILLPGSAPGVRLTSANTNTPLLESTGSQTTNVVALRVTVTDSSGATGFKDANVTIAHFVQEGSTGPGSPGFGTGDGGGDGVGWRGVVP